MNELGMLTGHVLVTGPAVAPVAYLAHIYIHTPPTLALPPPPPHPPGPCVCVAQVPHQRRGGPV